MYWELFKTFFVIGAFTIGGGVAMIPIIEREVVDHHRWLTDEEFLDVIAIAQASPGVMAANVSTYIGYKLKGLPGALLCLFANILPPFVTILVIARFFVFFKENQVMVEAFQGMRPAVAAIIASAVYTLGVKTHFSKREFVLAIGIAALVELLGLSPILFILGGGFGMILYHMAKTWRYNHINRK